MKIDEVVIDEKKRKKKRKKKSHYTGSGYYGGWFGDGTSSDGDAGGGMGESKEVNNIKECSGYIPKNAEEAKDPRWSMAITDDVKPGEEQRNLKKLGLK